MMNINFFKRKKIIEDNVTHKQLILNHLKKNKTITSWQAFELYGNTRISEYIRQLRVEGYQIASIPKKIKTRYGKTTEISVYTLQDN